MSALEITARNHESCWLWVQCIAAALLIAVANGPIVAWQTLEPLMLADNVFRNETYTTRINLLDAMNSQATAVGQATCILAGIIYDRAGPRAVAVYGSILTGVCLFGMGISIHNEELNWMLGPAYCGSVFFAFLNSFGSAYFLIKLPRYPSLVAAIGACSFALGDAVGIIAAGMNKVTGMTSWMFYYGMAVCSVLSACGLSCIFPSRQVFMSEVQQKKDQNTTDTDNPSDENQLHVSKQVCMTLYLFRRLPGLALVTVHLVSIYMLVMGLQVHQYQLYLALFGDPGATKLVNISSVIFSSTGVVALMFWGIYADTFSQRNAWAAIDICAVAFAVLVLIPLVPCQLGGQFMFALMLNLVSNMLPYRVAWSFAPRELLGTCSGMIWLFQGATQLFLTPLQEYAARQVIHGSDARRIYAVLVLWIIISLLSGISMHAHFSLHGIPEDGSISMQYVLCASESTGDRDGSLSGGTTGSDLERKPLASPKQAQRNKYRSEENGEVVSV